MLSARRLMALVLVLGVAAAFPPTGAAQGVDRTCELAAGYNDPSVRNVGYPDAAAGYWVASYAAVPGTRLRIRGQFPHARYISFNAYDVAGRPIDSLADLELSPDKGNANPFMPGASRRVKRRRYTAAVQFTTAPEHRAPNTLYAGTGQDGTPNVVGTLLYRIYLPDIGRGDLGGVPLPKLSLETADGRSEPVELVDCSHLTPPRAGLTDELAAQDGLPAGGGVPLPGYSPPLWRRFVNLPMAYADLLRDNAFADKTPLPEAMARLPLASAGGSGGFFSNRDNDYIYTPVSRGHGDLLVLEAKMPKFPDTRGGARRMPRRTDVRYFSLCQNETATTRWIACLTDDQVALGPNRRYRIVIGPAGRRPANARAECGTTWLPWGPAGEGVLIMRHMLADPGFANAIQRVPRDATKENIMRILGAYHPTGRYVADRATFEAEGCGA